MRPRTIDDIDAFMRDPASHGLGQGPVERIETHAALVYLAGDRARKIKKPVSLGYLDFATLERREQACRAELQLNRRTAPEIYLDVRPLTEQADGGLALGGDGPAVEWVLEMRRFDQDQLFSSLADRGVLDAGLMESLAAGLVDFHVRAERREPPGGTARFRHTVDGVLDELAAFGAVVGPDASVADLEADTRAQLDRFAGLIDSRAAAGFERWCHGDLHLRNICLWQGRPTPFDCLEFDADLARIDVLYDLAFLLMDLCHRGLGDLANHLYNAYLARWPHPEALTQIEGAAMLPFLMSVRAGIRAHVEARMASDRHRPERERDDERANAQAYFNLAHRLLRTGTPILVAVGGLSGSGKSTLARAIAARIGVLPGALMLRTDEIRKAHYGVPPEQRLPEAAYAPAVSERVYGVLVDRARAALASGQSVILDAVHDRAQDRDRAAAVAADAGVPFKGIWLDARREALIARVEARTGDASDADKTIVERQLSRETGHISWFRLNADQSVEALARRALALIDGTERGL